MKIDINDDKVTITDENSALMHAIRQTMMRDIEIWALTDGKMIVNQTTIEDETFLNNVAKLKINQQVLESLIKEPSDHEFALKIESKESFRIVTSDDINSEIFTQKGIYLCTLQSGKKLHAKFKLVKSSKRDSQDTAFLTISLMGQDVKSTDKKRIYNVRTLETHSLKKIVSLASKKLYDDFKDMYEYMKKIKTDYNDGLLFASEKYDYVTVNALVSEILLIYPTIKFCSASQDSPMANKIKMYIVDDGKNELKVIKSAIDSIIMRL